MQRCSSAARLASIRTGPRSQYPACLRDGRTPCAHLTSQNEHITPRVGEGRQLYSHHRGPKSAAGRRFTIARSSSCGIPEPLQLGGWVSRESCQQVPRVSAPQATHAPLWMYSLMWMYSGGCCPTELRACSRACSSCTIKFGCTVHCDCTPRPAGGCCPTELRGPWWCAVHSTVGSAASG
jgi:hypothetical protein